MTERLQIGIDPANVDKSRASIAEFFRPLKLPEMPEVAQELIRTLHSKNIVVAEIRDIISKGPTLTATVLRAANSAALGLPREVNTLDAAIAMIGLSRVRTVALAACMNQSFPDAPGFDRIEFWKQSMASAGYAQWLSNACGANDQEAWVTGMMANLGEIILLQSGQSTSRPPSWVMHHQLTRWQGQQQVLGFAAVNVTAELARRWRFPDGIVRGLDTAAAPLAEQPFCKLGAVVHLAAHLSEMDANQKLAPESIPQGLFTSLGLDRGWVLLNRPNPATFVNVPL